jgi:SAM-dependent methyltransferase
MDQHLQAYLEHVGIFEGVTSSFVPCEICGSKEFSPICDYVNIGSVKFAKLPVVCCKICGFIMQNPRFNKSFYDNYYNKYYRSLLFGESKPEKEFIIDQIRRGQFLFSNLAKYLNDTGCLLDVGCSAGGLMVPFARRGWTVFGTDPDIGYANFGRQNLGINIEVVAAEDMKFAEKQFDLIIIIGSLEHVFDVNATLKICRYAAKENSLLLIEGRAFNYGIMNQFFSHNHRRYLTATSIELLMQKHGWEPLWTTSDTLCGPTRPGGIYSLGRASTMMPNNVLLDLIQSGKRENFASLKAKTATLRGVT